MRKFIFFFKKSLKFLLLSTNFFILFIYVNFFLIKFYNKKKFFFLQHKGGFGHTITSPELFNYYYNDNWILIFAFSNRRHNKLINKIYNNRLFFLNTELINISSENFNKLLFNYIYFILKYLFKKNVFFFSDVLKTLPVNSFNKNLNINQNDLIKSRYYWVSHKINSQICVPYYLKLKFKNILERNSGEFKSRILFILRYKDFKESKIRLRDSQPLEFYKDIILSLVSNNFQIIFQGDLIDYPNWVKNLGKSVIFNNKFELSKDEYGIFAGMVSDVAIGPHSGAMYYTVAQKKKILILDHLFLGDALPNSIVSYPKVVFNSPSDFKDLIIGYNHNNINDQLKKYPYYTNLNSKETETIIFDFIHNLNNNDYGISPEEFGIRDGIMIDCKAKFSPAWLKIVGM